jgi:hypothetical protein
MSTLKRPRGKRYYTVEEANAMLPLLRSILRDITALATDLRERHERLSRFQRAGKEVSKDAYQEEVEPVQEQFERDQERMKDYEDELRKLNVELKDYFTGLVDFPCWMNGHEVYLCWRLGEPEVAYWHELDAGFGGRQRLKKDFTTI